MVFGVNLFFWSCIISLRKSAMIKGVFDLWKLKTRD